ncbi:MAG: LCP family protein [Turicibacter sp.]
MAKQQNNKVKKYGCLRSVLIFLLIVFIIVSGLGVSAYYMLSKVDREQLGDLNISQDILNNKKGTDVINIALFGVDSREASYENTRSDAMMILSFNKKSKEAFITSVVRDSYVYINSDYGYQKINHSYAYGGPTLTIQTMNQNFDLDIDKYVTVNFNAVEHIIDEMGGVEVEIKDYEFAELNRVIAEMNDENIGEPAALIKNTGLQNITGKQAVAYMRIRKVGNGDYERMERQRHVIMLTMEKALNYNKFKLIGLVDDFLPYIKTNLTSTEIISLGTQFLMSGTTDVQQLQLPSSDLSTGTTLSDGLYYLVPRTLSANVIDWHDIVYGIDDYKPTSTVQDLSTKISSRTGLY